MKKLYGIRYKNGRRQDFIALEDHPIPLYDGNDDCELVVLREEPTEPCEWCGDITTEGEMSRLADEMVAQEGCVSLIQTFEKTLQMHEWHFCPNCGRRLTDD